MFEDFILEPKGTLPLAIVYGLFYDLLRIILIPKSLILS
jgi:hypothetical protein